jgi:peroxiredoxin
MVRILKVLVVMALAAVLVLGLATTGCDGVDNNGNPNANGVSNGNVANGNPGEGEPDLVNGPGTIIDCDEYTGQGFRDKDPAPDFRFQDAAGTTFSLSDFKGRSVMLNFWRINCYWCIVEMPFIQQVYDEWPDENLVILTINIADSAEKVTEFLQENELSLPVLLDRAAEVAAQYRVSGIPCTFFIDREGLIRYIKFGACQSQEELEGLLNQFIALQEE